MADNGYIKSPLNYIGGKYKQLPQLFHWFPRRMNTMVDLFAGGGDVFVNIHAKKIIANDINYHVIGIFSAFKQLEIHELLQQIEGLINEWHLSQTNEATYISFRENYNQHPDPVKLFVLTCYSFNYQIRFNSHHKFNNPFGRNRSWFNPSLRENLIKFHSKLRNVNFYSENFKDMDLSLLGQGDFVYADPPYLITTGSYNDGKRGFEGWSEREEFALYEVLDSLNKAGVKFALSNVTMHKGRTNDILNDWRCRYHTHKINYSYRNSSYHGKNTDQITQEVLITNY